MCISSRIKKYLAEKDALDAKIVRLEKLKSATAPVKNSLTLLLADYAEEVSEELPVIWEEILAIGSQYNLSAQPLAADELRQWEAAQAENERLEQQVEKWSAAAAISELAVKNLRSQLAQIPTPESRGPESSPPYKGFHLAIEAPSILSSAKALSVGDQVEANTIESFLKTKGFSQSNDLEHFDEKYETYRGWDIYLDIPNGGILAIGLYNLEYNQSWDAITEYIQGIDSTFPECLADCDEIASWTRVLLDQVENLEAPGQLSLEFPDPTAEQIEEDSPEPKPESEEVADLIEKILCSHGFFMPDMKVNGVYDEDEKYENYRGWASYRQFHDKGVTGIGLDHENFGFWDASTEMIGDDDPTFPENFSDGDAIVAWIRRVIDEVVAIAPVENTEVPGQLSFEFPGSTSLTTESEEVKSFVKGLQQFGVVDHMKELTVKILDQEWKIEKLNDCVDGGMSFLFQTNDRGFTEAFTQKQLKQRTCSWAEFLEEALKKRIDAKRVESQPEQTKLQKLLIDNRNFSFEELGVLVNFQSVIAPADDTVAFESEELLITVGGHRQFREYYIDANTFVYQHKSASLHQVALAHAQYFLQDLEKNAAIQEKIAQYKAADVEQQPIKSVESESPKKETDTEFEAMGFNVNVHPQPPLGVTFRFLNGEGKVVFANSLTTSEIADRTWRICASDLIQSYRDKETARIEKEANPYKKPEDKFVEFVKISNAVGYLKQRDNGQLIAGYVAFSNKLPSGNRATTQAKSRAQKWAQWLKGTFELECDAPRITKRIISENSKQPFAYEIKIKGVSIGQLTKLAEEDFSLLPGEEEERQLNTELLRSETKAPPVPPGEIEQAAEPSNDGLTDEQYSKAVDEELALTSECGLNEDEIELVEMAKAAISTCDPGMVKTVNSVFKEVCEKNAANRVKVWNALTKNQQQTYKLLLQMEFAKAPDFSEQTPEYIVYIDGKANTSVWISLRTIDGKATRVWRYKGQRDDICYTTKEAAAIAAIQQQAG